MQAVMNGRSTMTGSKTNAMNRKEVLAAVRAIPAKNDFVWDRTDEDDRPLTREGMQAGMEALRKKRGRPAGSITKEQVAIRFDRDVLTALRATGPGWQTRVNDAMREWVKAHPAG
ncbi:MAG: BrnA antitoxin family protein [Burkholderiaceae bacterium]|nr:BrnA antitoxin family protein [Burkholderiaceae bacterium]